MPEAKKPEVVLVIGASNGTDALYIDGRRVCEREPLYAGDVLSALADKLGFTLDVKTVDEEDMREALGSVWAEYLYPVELAAVEPYFES